MVAVALIAVYMIPHQSAIALSSPLNLIVYENVDAVGGTYGATDPANPGTYETLEDGVQNLTIYPPSRIGYDFEGWTITLDGEATDGSTIGDSPTGDSPTIGFAPGVATLSIPANMSGTITLTADWEMKGGYTVEYDLGGGAYDGRDSFDKLEQVKWEDTDLLPGGTEYDETLLSRAGYDFTCWILIYRGEDHVTDMAAVSNEDAYGGLALDDAVMSVEIQAQWTPHTHSITYAYTGTAPDGAEAPPVDETDVEYGADRQAPAAPADVAGYAFGGWIAQGVTPDASGGYAMPDHDVAWAGGWQQDAYQPGDDSNNGGNSGTGCDTSSDSGSNSGGDAADGSSGGGMAAAQTTVAASSMRAAALVTIQQEDTPLAPAPTVEIAPEATPQAPNYILDLSTQMQMPYTPPVSWALFNLFLTGFTAVIAWMLMSDYFKKEEEKIKKYLPVRLFTVATTAVAIALFALTQDLRLTMTIYDQWTIWHFVIAALTAALAIIGRGRAEEAGI